MARYLVDPSQFDASTLVTMPNVNGLGYWECNIGGIAVGGQDLNIHERTGTLHFHQPHSRA